MPIMTYACPDVAPDILAMLPVAVGLAEVLRRRGTVTINVADLGDPLGAARFHENVVLLDARLHPDELGPTLVHELLHLFRGPSGPGGAAAEERHVEHVTQQIGRLVAGGAR